MIQISKTKVLVITMHCGVRSYIIDLKKKRKNELVWFRDTYKVKLLPGFDLSKRPVLMTVCHDLIYLRNLQNFCIIQRLRDTIDGCDGAFEPLKRTKEGVILLRQSRIGDSNATLVLQRLNLDYEYIANGIL
jgi:hypothetical protein